MKNITVKRHFDLFVKECNKWVEYFGLYNWLIEYEHGTEKSNCRAKVYCGFNGKIASVVLNKSWSEDPVTDYKIKRSAFHEIAEIWLCDIRAMFEGAVSSSTEDLQSVIHDKIRFMENRIFDGKK